MPDFYCDADFSFALILFLMEAAHGHRSNMVRILSLYLFDGGRNCHFQRRIETGDGVRKHAGCYGSGDHAIALEVSSKQGLKFDVFILRRRSYESDTQ